MVLFTILGVIVYLFLSVIFNGYVFNILWKWFIVPTFDLPVLSLANSIGVVTLIRFAFWKTENYIEYDPRNWIYTYLILIFTPLFALLLGYIVHLFM